jgi:hypothetical protein
MRKEPLTKVIHSKDHEDGVYTLRDVRGDAAWHPVQAVEDHRSHNGELYMVVNHLDYDKAAEKFA